jgi:hypothetical protein
MFEFCEAGLLNAQFSKMNIEELLSISLNLLFLLLLLLIFLLPPRP